MKDFCSLSLRLDKTHISFRAFAACAAAILDWRPKVRPCP